MLIGQKCPETAGLEAKLCVSISYMCNPKLCIDILIGRLTIFVA